MESRPYLNTSSGPVELRRPTSAAGYVVTGSTMAAVGALAMALGTETFFFLGALVGVVGSHGSHGGSQQVRGRIARPSGAMSALRRGYARAS